MSCYKTTIAKHCQVRKTVFKVDIVYLNALPAMEFRGSETCQRCVLDQGAGGAGLGEACLLPKSRSDTAL